MWSQMLQSRPMNETQKGKKKMKKLLAMLLTLSMVLSMAVGAVTVFAETEETRVIVDSMDRSVEIPADVQRIVCVGVGALR